MLSYQEIKKLKRHDPFITGNNQSYFVRGYFPIDRLLKILPNRISLPGDSRMAREFPTVPIIDGFHPCLLLFSRCFQVHDVITKRDLRPYLELLFYFPVIYASEGEERLCSYLPVLYLDYLLGTLGGLFLGLRKEFHPGLSYAESGSVHSFVLDKIIRANFQIDEPESGRDLDPFFSQIFNQPTATYTYLKRMVFYTTAVYPERVADASADFVWNYQGAQIRDGDQTLSNYCEYRFSTSWAMGYHKYFHPAA